MFKDYHKYLRVSLKVYLFVLVLVFIMKIVGLDYFGLDVNNPIMIKISNCLSNNHFGDVYYFTMLYLQLYFYLCMVCKKRKLYLYALMGTSINFAFQIIIPILKPVSWIYFIICFSITILLPMIINKKIQIKRQIAFTLLMNLYQIICLTIRNIGVAKNYNNFIIDSLLNIDQILLLAITYNLVFMEGGTRLCGEIQEVGSSLLKKINLSTLLKRLQRNLHNFKALDKETKLTYIIYFILSLIWNTLTIIIILLFAKLNSTIIECLFILTSFWLSKRTFGKPFHLPSMKQCFIVSNLTYYILNRITTPLGISILIPIMLGVGLSYITSKFVNKTHRALYKGMPKEKFEQTILKVTEKDSVRYKVCYDFFIKKENAIYLASKYNYTEAGIRQIIYMVKKEIKA